MNPEQKKSRKKTVLLIVIIAASLLIAGVVSCVIMINVCKYREKARIESGYRDGVNPVNLYAEDVTMIQLIATPEKYDGKTITFKCMTARNNKFPENTYAVGRHIMTCCVEDIQYCWMVAQDESGNEPQNKDWIAVTGKVSVQKHKLYKGKGPVLYVEKYEKADAPEQPVATFY